MNIEQKLKADILDLFTLTGAQYKVKGKIVNGEPISFVKSHLRDKGWSLPGSFYSEVEKLGFRVGEGEATRKGRRKSREVLFYVG